MEFSHRVTSGRDYSYGTSHQAGSTISRSPRYFRRVVRRLRHPESLGTAAREGTSKSFAVQTLSTCGPVFARREGSRGSCRSGSRCRHGHASCSECMAGVVGRQGRVPGFFLAVVTPITRMTSIQRMERVRPMNAADVNCRGIILADTANHRGDDFAASSIEVLRDNSLNPRDCSSGSSSNPALIQSPMNPAAHTASSDLPIHFPEDSIIENTPRRRRSRPHQQPPCCSRSPSG